MTTTSWFHLKSGYSAFAGIGATAKFANAMTAMVSILRVEISRNIQDLSSPFSPHARVDAYEAAFKVTIFREMPGILAVPLEIRASCRDFSLKNTEPRVGDRLGKVIGAGYSDDDENLGKPRVAGSKPTANAQEWREISWQNVTMCA